MPAAARFFNVLPLADSGNIARVSGDKFMFTRGRNDLHTEPVPSGAQQSLSACEIGVHLHFFVRQVVVLLNERSLLGFGHQRKLDAAVVEQCLAEFAVFQRKEVLQVLRGGDSGRTSSRMTTLFSARDIRQ